jgi:hypothetical protein
MFEICLKRGWAIPARAALDMCKMAEKRMWSSMTPLRQFRGVPGDVLRRAEAKQFVSESIYAKHAIIDINHSHGTVTLIW